MEFLRKLNKLREKLPPERQEAGMFRTLLEAHLWGLAREHAERSQAASYSDSTDMREAIGAIVMSAACLEAYINSVLIEDLDCSEEELNKTLESKWELAAQKIERPFDKGNEPFQSLNWLVGERNYVLHYKPSLTKPVKTGRVFVSQASARLTRDAARRAVQTCKSIITGFCERRGEAPPRWLKD